MTCLHCGTDVESYLVYTVGRDLGLFVSTPRGYDRACLKKVNCLYDVARKRK